MEPLRQGACGGRAGGASSQTVLGVALSPAVGSWASYLSSLSLGFLFCEMGTGGLKATERGFQQQSNVLEGGPRKALRATQPGAEPPRLDQGLPGEKPAAAGVPE